MRRFQHWKVLLPALQLALALVLWFYMPIDFRKDILRLIHEPTEHPFRFRVPSLGWEVRARYFPPLSGRLLYGINFPADAAHVFIVRNIFIPYENRMHRGVPQWDISVPIRDPEALPPREIIYPLHLGDIVFFGFVVLLWIWVGARIDDYPSGYRNRYATRNRIVCWIEIGVLVALLVLCGVRSFGLVAQNESLHFRQVGAAGALWCVLILLHLIASLRLAFAKREDIPLGTEATRRNI